MSASLLRSTTSSQRKAVSACVASRGLNLGARQMILPSSSSSRRLASSIHFPESGLYPRRGNLFSRTSLSRPSAPLWSKNSFRFFQTESDFHTAADETLEGIQDAVDETLEEKGIPDFEVNFASGVLTLVFPPHGTWVINKQTPNQQLWWSSPVSGPRRYEYEDGEWVYTRDDSHSMTLSQALQEEIKQIYGVEIDL